MYNGLYIIFLITVFFLYWLIADRRLWQIFFLLLASYLFYAQAGLKPVFLLLAISTIDFLITRRIAGSDNQKTRKRLLYVSLIIDIGTLSLFKYANFFLDAMSNAVSLVGFKISALELHIFLPLGISFFIFQSIAYVVDVYRKDIEPADNYFQYLLFISFFPTIVAGPIMRAKQLLPQFRSNFRLDAKTGGMALFLIIIGMIKKIAIADYLAVNFIERVFDFPERFSTLEILVAIYGYALQIYADFSGYSDVAIGPALLLGFTLPNNFNLPYQSRDLPEFWRRWHITLSNWLRDYIFFSVVGARVRNTRMLYFGLIVTMALGGLWHGASWTFLIWGILHGLGLCLARWIENLRRSWKMPRRNTIWSTAVGIFITFHFVCFSWIFFRSETLGQAVKMLARLPALTFDHSNLPLPVILIIFFGLCAHWLPDNIWNSITDRFIELPAIGQAALIFVISLGLYFVASSDIVPFIYSKF